MALLLPTFSIIKSVRSQQYTYYMTENEGVYGYVRSGDEHVSSPHAKIEIERAKIDRKFVHLRFCYSNKYWARNGPGSNDIWIKASSDQPDEDTSKWSCTLFEPILQNDGTFILIHVQSGRRLQANGAGVWDMAYRVFMGNIHVGGGDPDPFLHGFTFVDWDSLVIMPKHVTFKGDNDKYLRSGWIQRHEYLQFSSDDGNEEATAYEVTMHPDGHLRITSNFFGKFWRRSPNWIWADSTDTNGNDIDTLFWPIKIDNNTIALRNAGNNRFCKRLTTEGKTDCLNAAVSTITADARLKVEELVFERDIFDVVYRMNDARIFDEMAVIAGRGEATNLSSEESALTIRVSYEEASSYSFSNNLSITAGVSTKISAGFPFIAEGNIEVSTAVTTSFEWNRTTEERKTAEASYQAIVPPRSTIRINYVATRGTCNVPFSYTRRDKLSGDGSFVTTRHIDGVYSGVNYYGFHFEQVAIERVSEKLLATHLD